MSRQYFSTGVLAPSVTPTYEGEVFVDTVADKVYFSIGTASSADWIPLPTLSSEITTDEDLALAGLYKIKKALGMDFQTALELTVATGAVTQTQSHHTIDTEADAAADDLDTITIASDMSILLVTLANAARIITLKHGTGNLNLPDNTDIVMAENTVYFLLYNGTAWNLVGSSGGGSSLPVADTTSIVEGSVDATKEMRIEVDGLTTATTRVATMPDKDITLGTDDDAIHDNVAGEINAITEKVTPVNGDWVLIEDSADSNNKKKSQLGNLPSGGGSSLPVADTTSIVEGSVDSTKEMRIEVDGLTTGTVRVATMPDADITLGTDSSAIHDNVASEITAITEKTSMAVDDEFIIEDSADSNNKKSLKRSTLGQDIQNTQTGTTYTLVLSDASKSVTMSNASAQTLTIPTNASVAFATNTVIVVWQLGAATCTITGDTGVTVNGTSAGSVDIGNQYSAAVLTKTGTDTWIVSSGTNVTGTVRAYTKQQNFGTTTLVDGANISWDLDDNQVSKVTLAGNRTLDNPTNMVDGGTYILRVIQDATGSRTLAYGTAYRWVGGAAPVLTTTANAVDYITFVSDGTNMDGVISKGFS